MREFSEGLICLSGDDDGPIQEWLEKNDMEQARAQVAELKDIFGADDFYIELMDHALETQPATIASLRQLAEEFDLKVVATNATQTKSTSSPLPKCASSSRTFPMLVITH